MDTEPELQFSYSQLGLIAAACMFLVGWGESVATHRPAAAQAVALDGSNPSAAESAAAAARRRRSENLGKLAMATGIVTAAAVLTANIAKRLKRDRKP